MSERRNKGIYPRVYNDDGGLKFVFDHYGQHYTIRFAGRPMFLIEKQYEMFGGQNFKYIYNLAKTQDRKNTKQNPETQKNLEALMKATISVQDMLNLVKAIADDGNPPIVCYAKDYLPIG